MLLVVVVGAGVLLLSGGDKDTPVSTPTRPPAAPGSTRSRVRASPCRHRP
ncbi:hypothetical protein ACFQX7_26535 [Luedemannella flava]